MFVYYLNNPLLSTTASFDNLTDSSLEDLKNEGTPAPCDNFAQVSESLKEKKMARGGGRQGTLHSPAKRRANQLQMETVSICTLSWMLQRRRESLWMTSDDDEYL